MLKKILVASCLLVASMASHATIISYGDYKRDTGGTCSDIEKDCKYNIVTGGGLEWLMWDVTKGMSINSALDVYGERGWTVATMSDMAPLLNGFDFGRTDWNIEEEYDFQDSWLGWTTEEQSQHRLFMSMFGRTNSPANVSCVITQLEGCFDPNDPYELASALFSVDGYGRLNALVQIRDDITVNHFGGNVRRGEHYVTIDTLGWSASDAWENKGVVLVRSAVISPVPLPTSISLLALGLVALGFRRRQALRR